MTYYSMQNDATDAFLNTILTDLSAGNHDVSTLIAFVQWLNDANLVIYREFDFKPAQRMNGIKLALQFAGLDVASLSYTEITSIVDLLTEI